jgi:hypothetical protein
MRKLTLFRGSLKKDSSGTASPSPTKMMSSGAFAGAWNVTRNVQSLAM